MVDDSLDDVVLSGLRLVSDDPNEWIVPCTANAYDCFLDWWAALAHTPKGLSELSSEVKDDLLYLADDYEQLQSEAFQGTSTVPHQAKIRSVLRQICQHGLTTTQTARLVRSTPQQVMAELYCNRPLTPQDINIRLEAEQSLRDGNTIPQVVESSGLTRDQIETLVDTLGIQVRHTINPYSTDIRKQAIELRLQGLTNQQVAEQLAEHGHTVKPSTISQWWGRYNRRNQESQDKCQG